MEIIIANFFEIERFPRFGIYEGTHLRHTPLIWAICEIFMPLEDISDEQDYSLIIEDYPFLIYSYIH